MTNTTGRPWNMVWNKVGESFARPFKESRKDPRRPKYVNRFSKKVTGFMTIEKKARAIDEFIVTVRIFHRGGETAFTRTFKGAELATFADVPNRDLDANDAAYAAEVGADFAIPGLFARKGDQALFPAPGTGRLGDAVFYVQIKPFFSHEMDRMIRTGSVEPRKD